MRARQSRRLHVPAQAAAHAADSIRHNRLAITRSAEHDAALMRAAANRLGDGTNKARIIDRFGRVRAEVVDRMAIRQKTRFDNLLVTITGVVRTDGNFHGVSTLSRKMTNTTAI